MRIAIFAVGICLSAPAWADVPEIRSEARAALQAGRAEEAIAALEAGIVAHPEAAPLYADLGSARLAAGTFGSAAEAFERSLEIDPAQPVVRYNLAYALREDGELDRAVEVYRAYLEENPTDADAWYGLAQAEERRSSWAGAAEAYERYGASEKRPEQQPWVAKALARASELRALTPAPLVSPAPPTDATELATAETPASPPAPTAAVPLPAPSLSEPTEAEPAPSAGTSPSFRVQASARGDAFTESLAALRSGRYGEALKRLEALPPESRASDYAVIAAQAGAHLGLYEGKKAARLYTQALGMAPDSATPTLLLGLAEAQRINGDVGRARASFDRLLALPDAPDRLKSVAQARRAAL